MRHSTPRQVSRELHDLSLCHGMILRWFPIAILRFLAGAHACLHIAVRNSGTLYEKGEVDL